MTDLFYRVFEDKHRGSRELIKDRLQVYLPFVRPLLDIYPEGCATDLGCGRGEWLELLTQSGFNPKGVDLDGGMLQACELMGLSAIRADALEFLKKTESNSQLIVSAFHVVEHIEFKQLRVLVSEAMRVLKPGGLLILETPNPENIAVATRNFYLDPTHRRPIPPALLEFVAEFAGFERVKTLRLQEPEGISSNDNIGLTELINCVSPDYAVIAQKKADANVMAQSQEFFDANFGVSIDTLATKLDQRLARIEAKSVYVLQLAQQAEAKAQQAEAKAQQAEAKAQQAEVVASQHVEQLTAVYSSRSWRITASFRWFFYQVHRLKTEGLRSRLKSFVKKVLRKLNLALLARPAFRQRLVKWSRRCGFYGVLKIMRDRLHDRPSEILTLAVVPHMAIDIDVSKLSPRARKIYTDLKQVIKVQEGSRS